MANPLLDDYLPTADEVTTEMVSATRQRLAALWALHDPDTDLSSNTVVGDRILTPAAFTLAAVEEAMRRFMSDLDPDNVSRGIIYSCSFVEKFLDNFGVYALPDARGTGTVRLEFSVNATVELPYEVDRGTRFRTAEGEPELTLFLPEDGPLKLVAAGGTLCGTGNELRLVEIGSSKFAVDVPVTSEEAVTVEAGAVLEMTTIPDNLTSAICLDGFTDTAPSASLAKLAQLTRDTVYAASPGQLGGLRRFMRQMLPQLKLVMAAGPGDGEMLRGYENALGLSTPAADIYVRGGNAFREEQQLVWLNYDATNTRFGGTWVPIQTPLLMRGIVWEGNENVVLDTTVWGRSTDEVKAPLLSAAGSGYDEYFVTLPMPEEDGVELIETSIPSDHTVGAWFVVTYLSDPDVVPARALLGSSDCRPIGVDVLVKPPVTIEFENLTLSYRRRAGQSLRLTTANTEIASHVNGCGWPDRMTSAPWIDSMYYAGASTVDCQVAAAVKWTVADRWLEAGSDDPVTDLDSALSTSFVPPELLIDSSTGDALTPDTSEIEAALSESEPLVYSEAGASCGWHNLGWFIETQNIIFTEL